MSIAVAAAVAPETEMDLVYRHLTGDPSAFEEIYRRFESMVFNLALRLSGEPEVAADLSQEIFLRVYRHLGKFHGRSTLKTWIYRVALNCCRTRLKRRHQRRQRMRRDEGLERLADDQRGPEERALAGDAGATVEAALARLPAVFREAVVLRDLEGLAYDEIATAVGVRVGTVRSRIARGREQLRRLLEESS